jgi:hypothetical protein
MKTLLLFLALFVSAGSSGWSAEAAKTELKLRHVVALKFKPEATPEQIKKVEDAFRALANRIPQIAGFECGTNNSTENLNKGFTHCFLVTFKSEKDRAVYLPHPEHKAFVAILKPVMEDAFVLDYWAKD